MSLDAFEGGAQAQKIGPGFDELRLAVTPEGTPTPRRGLWLFTTRYLSGGAAGMHALGLYDLLQIGTGKTAADRPDLFEAYSHMTEKLMHHDLTNRSKRVMRMASWQHDELKTMLSILCHRGDVYTILFFPPDNAAMIARYLQNDAAGVAAFKLSVVGDVQRHNAACEGKIALFDFLNHNAVTDENIVNGQSDNYLDLIHFRPPVGLRLLARMLGRRGAESRLGVELVRPGGVLH